MAQGQESDAQATPQTGSPAETGGFTVPVPTPSGNRTVTLALLVAFGTFWLAGPQGISKLGRIQRYLVANPTAPDTSLTMLPKSDASPSGASSVINAKSLFGWAGLFVMLTILADFEPTSQLAASFAMLILLTTLLALGPDALGNIGKFVSSTQGA